MQYNLQRSLANSLEVVAQTLTAQSDRLLEKEVGLSLTQFRLLCALTSGCCQRTIGEHLRLTPGAISRQVELLRQRQLITREANTENRREHVVALTAQGKELVGQGSELLDTLYAQYFATLDPTVQGTLHTALDELNVTPHHP